MTAVFFLIKRFMEIIVDSHKILRNTRATATHLNGCDKWINAKCVYMCLFIYLDFPKS